MLMTWDYVFPVERLGTLNTRSFVPLYVQLADQISTLIQEQGEQAVGKALPSEAECGQILGVSRPTVRQAMARLLSQGLIKREKGRGTFVARPKLTHDVSHDFEEEMRSAAHRVRYTLLAWEPVIPPTQVVAIFLPADPVIKFRLLRRLRWVDEQLVGIEERYIPPDMAARISRAQVKSQSIFGLLRRLEGARVAQLEEQVSSRVADRDTAGLLKVKVGAPLLVRTSTFRGQNGKPLVYGTQTFVAEHYSVRFTLNFSAPPG